MQKSNTTNLEYKGYIGSIEISQEDNCLYGSVQGLNKALISYEGNTLEELRIDFEGAIEDYLEMCHDKGKHPQTSTLS